MGGVERVYLDLKGYIIGSITPDLLTLYYIV